MVMIEDKNKPKQSIRKTSVEKISQNHTPVVKWVQVSSSNINSVLYLPKEKHLYVRFHSKTTKDATIVYKYFNVNPELYEALIDASSKGSFFNKYIKNNPAISFKKLTLSEVETSRELKKKE